MADSQLNVVVRGRDELTPQLKTIESGLIRFVGSVTSALAALKIAAFPITQATDFQRELANVTKTTNFTQRQIKNLGDELGQLSLRTDNSAVDLAKIAAAAGQQGLGKEGVEGILKFTDSVARMASVLDLTAENAASSIGKILNIFQIPLKEVEKVSSAINQVSNNSTARATELLNVLKRLGDAGGSLKFTQSLALSATAIDLGATPEVAGTTLSKFINALKVRNDEFAKLLGRTKEQLAIDTKNDAFKVFVTTLQKLNEVRLEDRYKVITKLFGGGRITALNDKFLQDVLKNSSILGKNLSQAEGGFASENSSKKEQATVLATLAKQVDILKNSFKELNRSAGEDLLGPLAAYVAQLRIALQNPAVKSFVAAIVHSIGDLIETFVKATKFLASLNINWENFINVLKVFLLLKVGTFFLNLLSQLPGVGKLLGGVASQATAAGAAAGAAGRAGAAAAQQQTTALGALRAAIAETTAAYRAALAAREAIALRESELVAKQIAERAAIARAALLDTAAKTATRQSKIENSALNTAVVSSANVAKAGGAALTNAQLTGKAAIDNAVATGNARRLAAERAHQSQMALIAEQFKGVRTKIEKETRDGIIASEQAAFVRQMASLKVADAKRIAEAEKFAALIVGITASRVEQELALERSKVAAQTKIAAGFASRKAAADAAATSAALAAAAASGAVLVAGGNRGTPAPAGPRPPPVPPAGAAGGLVGRLGNILAATASMNVFTTALSLAGKAVRFLFASLGPLYLLFVILSSVLDHFGILDKLPGMWGKLTDALGFTTEATRKLDQANKDAAFAREKEKKDLDDLLERYGKLKDAKTGLVDDKKIKEVSDNFKGATNDNDIITGLQGLNLLLAGSQAETKRAEEALKAVPKAYAKSIADTATLKVQLDAAQKELLKAQEDEGSTNSFNTEGIPSQDAGIVRTLRERVDSLQKQLADEANKQAKQFGLNTQQALQDSTVLITGKAEQIKKILGGIFTPQTSKLFDEFYPQVVAAKKALAELESTTANDIANTTNPQLAKLEKAKNALATAIGTKAQDDAKARLKLVEAEIEAQKAIIVKTIADVGLALDKLKNNNTVSAVVKTSAANTLLFLNQSLENLELIKTVKDDVTKENRIPFTGALVNPTQNTPPKADRAFSLGGEGKVESEAKKLAKAREEVRRAEIDAQVAIQRQANDSFLQEDQRLYDSGLVALRDFYDHKDSIERSNLADEINQQQARIASKRLEQNDKHLKESDRVKIDAEIIGLEAQKKVLIDKLQQIPKQTADALRKAAKEFNEGILNDKLDIGRVLGVSDFSEELDTQFALITSQLSTRIARLETELKNNEPGITRAFIDSFKLSGLLKAIDPVLQSVANKARLTADAVQNDFARINQAVKEGRLTDREAERATNDARAKEALAIAVQIAESEKLIDETVKRTAKETGATEATIRATDEFTKQQTAIDGLRVKYEELNVAVDAVATSLNQSVESGLTKGLESIMTGTTGGLKKLLKTFASDFTNTINGIVAKDLSQDFIKSFLGGGGTGGIGGFFSKLLNPSGVGGKAKDSVLTNKELLGRSEATPMFVKVVGRPSDKDPTEPKPIEELFGKDGGGPNLADLLGKQDNVNELLDVPDIESLKATDFSTQAEDAIASVGDGLTSGLGKLSETAEGGGFGLDSLFGSLGSALSAIFSSLSGSASSGSEGGGTNWAALASTVASFFHTGGVVGEGAVTGRVNPMVFAGAMRYHTGGIAGLQADEVPAVLKRGEEVLTANDSRHRNNGGGSIHAPVTMIINTPDANSFRRSQDQVAASTGSAVSRSIKRNK